jgi:hypothetical protein
MAALAERVATATGFCTLLPLAIEYPFWDERLPETLLYFAEPLLIRARESSESIQQRAIAALELALDENSHRALTRDAAAYQLLASGTLGSGGFYHLGKRIRSIVTRRPYVPEHTPAHTPAKLSGGAQE